MKEKDMYWVFRQSFDYLYRQEHKSHYFKFSDMNLIQEAFDSYCLYDWTFFWIEYKLNKNKNMFCFKSIFNWSEHQIKWLSHIKECWWKWIVIIKFEETKKIYWYDINFVNNNYESNIKVWEGHELKKIKDEIWRYIYDIKPMLNYGRF